MSTESTALRYRGGTASPSELNAAIAAFWDAYESDAAVRRAAAQAGVDVAWLDGLDPAQRRRLVTVEGEEGGLDPLALAVVVHFALPVSTAVAIDLWRKLLLPRLERRWGAAAVGEEQARAGPAWEG